MGNSMWHLIVQADFITKLILLLLLGISIVCWAIFFYKLILLRIKKRQMVAARKDMKNVTQFEQLLEIASKYAGTMPGYFLARNLNFLKSILLSPEGEAKKGLSLSELELVQQHVDQTVEDVLHAEESYMSFLSTTSAVAPLIGLFGTVWGLIHAFVRISERQSADIATVAPGIAEALVTTLTGLVVAIPAYVMFSYCSSQIRKLDRHFIRLSDQFMVLVQRLMSK